MHPCSLLHFGCTTPPTLPLSPSLGLSTPPPCLSPSQPRFLRPPNYHLSHVLFREAAQSHKTYPSPARKLPHQALPINFLLFPACKSSPANRPRPPGSFPPPRSLTSCPSHYASAPSPYKAARQCELRDGAPQPRPTALTWASDATRRRSRAGSPAARRPPLVVPLRPAAPAAPLRAPASGFRRGGAEACRQPATGAGRHKTRSSSDQASLPRFLFQRSSAGV